MCSVLVLVVGDSTVNKIDTVSSLESVSKVHSSTTYMPNFAQKERNSADELDPPSHPKKVFLQAMSTSLQA